MKKSLTIITLLAGAVGAYSQGITAGNVIFENYGGGPTISIWSPQTANPSLQQTGQTANDVPAGSTVYSGVPIGGAATGTAPFFYTDGADYTVALWAAAGLSQSLTAANQIATATMATSGGTGTAHEVNVGGNAGSWTTSATVTIPGSTAGSSGTATIELAAWFNGGGSITSYANALAAGDPAGLSGSANMTGLGGTFSTTSPPVVPPPLSGLTSFSLTTVPEPSTIALGVIGASAFLMRLRRK